MSIKDFFKQFMVYFRVTQQCFSVLREAPDSPSGCVTSDLSLTGRKTDRLFQNVGLPGCQTWIASKNLILDKYKIEFSLFHNIII